MTQRRWTLRGGDADQGTVLIITGHVDRLDALAIEVSTHGYYTFVAIPDAVAALCAVTRFDLIVVLGDVSQEQRDRFAQIAPPIGEKLLTIEGNDDDHIVDRIRSRLGD